MDIQILLKDNNMSDFPLIKNTNLFLSDKPSVYAIREKAKNILLKNGYPSTKNESWKYTNIDPILKSNFDISAEQSICGHDCCKNTKNTYFIEIKFCKGQLHIEDYDLPDGLTITPLPLALYENEYKQYLLKSFELEKHPFATLNSIYIEQGICMHVQKNKQINKPIHIIYNQTDCEHIQINIHNLIILEKNASLDFIETFSSKNSNYYLSNIVNEFYLHEASQLTHYKKQKESINAYHIALNSAKIKQSAKYIQYYFSEGAKISRHENIINLDQKQACAEIYSAYTTKKDSLTDITTNINHNEQETISNQYAKCVLNEDSSAVFQGKIHISKDAIKTSGHQLHKALYLHENANLNCKPELEIYADDVKCSHGASCGEIDKEQLFYLTSRGIAQSDAIKMLTDAHLNEIYALIENEEIRDILSK